MSARDDGGSAFPRSLPAGEWPLASVAEMLKSYAGMTLRDYFAAQAIGAAYAQCASVTGLTGGWAPVAQIAYVIADHMLVERSR